MAIERKFKIGKPILEVKNKNMKKFYRYKILFHLHLDILTKLDNKSP